MGAQTEKIQKQDLCRQIEAYSVIWLKNPGYDFLGH